MSNYEPIRDFYLNIDDYNAKAGEVGIPFSRKLFIHASLPHEFRKYLKDLSSNGYSKDEVRSVLIDILNNAYHDRKI